MADGGGGAAADDVDAQCCTPTIAFRAMERCRTTIEDFAMTYFPLHGLELPKDLFRFLDVLLFVEATIYQMDEDNESLSGRGALLPGHRFPAAAALAAVLRHKGLWDARVEAELESGYRYWELERRICCAMARHDLAAACKRQRQEQQQQQQQQGQQQDTEEGRQPPPAPARHSPSAPPFDPGFTWADALAAHEAKSFDYRLLHLLLHKLAGRPYDEALLAFMAADERLVDIGDDLTDYEDDVVANSFNVYRAHLHLYGPTGAQLLLAERISSLEAERARLLARLPARQRALVEARAAAAAEGQGSEKWIMPAPVVAEGAFRERERRHEREERAAAAAAAAGGPVAE